MPALVAARYNPDLKAKYQRFVDAGKPTKIAISAVMRKLVVTPSVQNPRPYQRAVIKTHGPRVARLKQSHADQALTGRVGQN